MNEKESVKGLILSDFFDLAYSAHRNTSFVPERRAKQIIQSYSEQLESDLKELGDNTGNYQTKYIEHFKNWLNAKSNCISSMITGGSNFPVNRAIKSNNRESARYNDFQSWREKYFKAVNRIPTKSPEEEILLAEQKVETLTNLQIEYKAINKELKKVKLTDIKSVIEHLRGLDFSDNSIKAIDEHNGFFYVPSYRLTNNNAKIKSAKQKVQIMAVRIERKKDFQPVEFEGGYYTIEDDRVKIFHDEKPSTETIQKLKSNGFRWSPNWKCWCRKHTGNALYAASEITNSKN